MFISLSSMCAAMVMLGIIICGGGSHGLVWVFLAYFLCGGCRHVRCL